MPAIESSVSILIFSVALGYLLGAVPFGLLVTRFLGLGDLRKIGSGNIGATNVLRTGSKAAAVSTLVLDGGKGAAAVLIARAVAAEDAAQLAGFAAFLGHIFPVWLGFKGGKGVSTFFGTLLALAWPVGLAAAATWLATALISRMSSLSGLVAVASTVIWVIAFARPELLGLMVAFNALVLFRHRENIARLRAGTEPRIGKK